MPKTSTQTEILRLLAVTPHTSAELADISQCSMRNIRRHLAELEKEGIIIAQTNPADKRSILYTLSNQEPPVTVTPPETQTEAPCTECDTHISHKTAECSTCPLTVCDLEHDAIQLGIVDAFTAKILPNLAESKQWERRQNPHTKVWTIYPPAKHPLTLQVAVDTVTVYSSEPGDCEWIVSWFSSWLGAIHPHPETLTHKLRHPEIYRDEQTIVITDQATIEALRTISAPYADPRNRVQYIESPNTTTPGLKIYERGGTMRIEFDARDETRARSAMVMRRELLEILPNVAARPGLFLEWRNRYYNPVIQPVIINLEQQDVVTALKNIESVLLMMMSRLENLETRVDSFYDDKLAALLHRLDTMSDTDVSDLSNVLAEYVGDINAATVFIGAWQIWSSSRYRGSVTRSDIEALFDRVYIDIDMAQIEAAVGVLIHKRLLEHNIEHIHFSKSGVAVGKALSAANRR